ncbi:MAG: RlmE family RNA methyltransferase [Polyangiaceae bacterium]|nr:RlmE family RNA methyltransferase [Polyangiaceae bacterium]
MTKNPYNRVDPRTLAARAQGYPARSIFKLEEIDRRVKLFKGGQRVLDLGAAPGSWTLYAAKRVGSSGRVVAIDLKPIEEAMPPWVTSSVGDIFQVPSESVAGAGPYDVVMSDMAPNTSGSKVHDQTVSFELVMRALEFAAHVGKSGSHFVAKLFMSNQFTEAKSAIQKQYSDMTTIRPQGTRKPSSEVFLVGLRKR